MSQLSIKVSAKGEALIATLQKEIFNRRRKKITANQVVETLVESGAKSQSDKRYAASWKNLIKDIEKAAKVSELHGNKPANISADEWALILSHRTRKASSAKKTSTKTSLKRSTLKKASSKPAVKKTVAKKVLEKKAAAKVSTAKRVATAKVKTAVKKVASAQAKKSSVSSNSVSKRISKALASRTAKQSKKNSPKALKV